jgi:hypothetical protein
MVQLSVDENQMKDLFKQAIMELLQEQGELFHSVIAEVIEDIALAKAIKEGESTENVRREEIFEILEGAA